MVHAKETPKMGLVTLPKNAKPKEVPIPDLAPPDTECVAHVILQNTIENPIFHNAILFSYCPLWCTNQRKLHVF